MSVIGCRLVDKASCCRIEAYNRQCSSRIIDERVTWHCRLVCPCHGFKFGTNEASVLLLLLSVGGLWVGGPVEGFLLLFLKFFLSPVGCWVLCVGCKGVGVHCLLYLPVVELFVVGCRVPVFGCRMLILDCRVSLTVVVMLFPGCRLSVDSCWLLIFCAGCRSVFFIVGAQLCLQFVENKIHC